MKVRYENHQVSSDPMDGIVIADSKVLSEILDSRRNDSPFFARLIGDNGFEIMVGIGGNLGCVQHSRSDGEPPYLMATSTDPPLRSGYVEFLTANTLTPCAARYVVRFDEVKEIALYFLATGERSPSVGWQVLNPRAIKEDALGSVRQNDRSVS